jgi:hypothetical protein
MLRSGGAIGATAAIAKMGMVGNLREKADPTPTWVA